MLRLKTMALGCASIVLCASRWASAATIEYDLGHVFSGDTPPTSGPWLHVKFDDGGSAGSVTMTLTGLGAESDFFIDGRGWYFNSSRAGLTSSSFSQSSGPTAAVVVDYDELQADGDGKYDFQLTWPATPGGRFNGNSSAVFTISLAGLVATDFDDLSVPAAGSGPFHTAAHIQGFSTGGSSWIADGTVVPLPAAAWMGMALLGGVGGAGYIRRCRLAGV